jgi:hypothetical protein
MARQYKQPVQYGRESAHKSWAPGDHSSLGDYMRDSSHQRGTERAGPGRSRQLEIPLSLNSKQAACFSSSTGFSVVTAGISPGAEILTPARILSSACFSLVAGTSSSARILGSAMIFTYAMILPSTMIFGSAMYSMAAIFSVCAMHLYIFFSASILIVFHIITGCVPAFRAMQLF